MNPVAVDRPAPFTSRPLVPADVPAVTEVLADCELHDIGEVYVDPACLDYTKALDVAGHKNLIVHPRVGQMLLATLTDYPMAVARAIAEHHERLDRSGYPARLDGDEISSLGKVLAIVEAVLGSLSTTHAPLTRASFALRGRQRDRSRLPGWIVTRARLRPRG